MDIATARDVSAFAPQVGSVFRIEVDERRFIDATLVEAERCTGRAGNASEGARTAFSLLFAVPDDAPLQQRTYKISQEQLGEMALFLVPVGPGLLESTFN